MYHGHYSSSNNISRYVNIQNFKVHNRKHYEYWMFGINNITGPSIHNNTCFLLFSFHFPISLSKSIYNNNLRQWDILSEYQWQHLVGECANVLQRQWKALFCQRWQSETLLHWKRSRGRQTWEFYDEGLSLLGWKQGNVCVHTNVRRPEFCRIHSGR